MIAFRTSRNRGEFDTHGGDQASTWVLKQKEQTGEHEDLVKNMHNVVANDNYAIAA